MLFKPCSGTARTAARPPYVAAGSSCGRAVQRPCIMHGEIRPCNTVTPLHRASHPARCSPAPSTGDQSDPQPALPRRAVLLAVGTGVLCATASMPAAAEDAAKRRNLPVAELQNIIEQDFVEVRSEGMEPGARCSPCVAVDVGTRVLNQVKAMTTGCTVTCARDNTTRLEG